MIKGGSKHMKIKLETATGKVVKVEDENGKKATEVTPAEIEQIYQSKGFKYVGVILHAESSPGCVYVITASGRAVKVCY
jgi:uncharacterized protein Veg